MKILITGGAGFIGSHLTEMLLQQGHRVVIIDDLSTGSIDNIDGAKDNPSFRYYIDSIMNKPLLAELIDAADAVYHLAAAVGVRLIIESPVRTIETNVKGTEAVLEIAAKKKKKVLVASTSEVYGKTETVPFSEENDLILGPTVKSRWSYACSKMLDEFLAQAYWHEKGVPTVIARLFNTVGPRQTGRYGMVLPNFISQALANEPITIYGDGQQSRCFNWVGDTVAGLIGLMEHPKSAGQVFNIGNNFEVTIEQAALKVKELTGSKSNLVKIPYEKAYEAGFEDMRRRVPDIRKIQTWIGYKASATFDDIIRRMVDHAVEQRKLSV